jgi:hypothetical protein
MPTKAATKTTNPFGAVADELGSLEKEMAPYAQKLARIECLRKVLRASCGAEPEDEWMVSGERFVAVLGPRAMERKIDIVKLVKAVGAPAFARFASCTLKALEGSVAPAVVAEVTVSGRTGSRPIKTFEKGSPA